MKTLTLKKQKLTNFYEIGEPSHKYTVAGFCVSLPVFLFLCLYPPTVLVKFGKVAG